MINLINRRNVFESTVHEANLVTLHADTIRAVGVNSALLLTAMLKAAQHQDDSEEGKTVTFHKRDIEDCTTLKVPAQLSALGKLSDKNYCEFLYSSAEDTFSVTFAYPIAHIVKAVGLGLSPYEQHIKEEEQRNELQFPKTA
jgi:hypothetical protein